MTTVWPAAFSSRKSAMTSSQVFTGRFVGRQDLRAVDDGPGREHPSGGVKYSSPGAGFGRRTRMNASTAGQRSRIKECRWRGCGLVCTVFLEKYLKYWHDDDRLLAVGWREC
jgi:hypothetical protein